MYTVYGNNIEICTIYALLLLILLCFDVEH